MSKLEPIERDEFVQLLEAHAGRSLTLNEDARLRTLAARDRSGAAEVAAFDDLHTGFDAELVLFESVSAPITAAEEGDEGYARLARIAAAGEDTLRARLQFAGAVTGPVPHHARRRRAWLTIGTLAAGLLVAWLVWGRQDHPSLMPGNPNDSVLGAAARIVMQAELRADRPELSWHVVVGASKYDARIEDATGQPVLVRPDPLAAAARWAIAPQDYARLRTLARDGELRLRVVARDGAGLTIATTGDLPLRVID